MSGYTSQSGEDNGCSLRGTRARFDSGDCRCYGRTWRRGEDAARLAAAGSPTAAAGSVRTVEYPRGTPGGNGDPQTNNARPFCLLHPLVSKFPGGRRRYSKLSIVYSTPLKSKLIPGATIPSSNITLSPASLSFIVEPLSMASMASPDAFNKQYSGRPDLLILSRGH